MNTSAPTTKPDIRELDVMLIGGRRGVIPKLIRAVTRCKYSHAGIVVNYLGELYILEAGNRGFNPSKTLTAWLEEKDANRDAYAFLRAPEEFNLTVGLNRLKELTGKSYEFVNLLFYQLIKATTGKWIGSKNSNKLICSEAVAYVYTEYFEKPYETTPEELYANPNFTTVFEKV